ncbi:hypothetical protein PINS_up022235 [Pythium insidiosum]|nr:hypothetical protein PINS_up022235 [Pythium insidiosum]
MCRRPSQGSFVAPAAPVQVYDNRANATDRTNVQTADLCNLDYTGCPCTLRNNVTSRCNDNGKCSDSLVACAADAQLLDPCENGYCFNFLSSKRLTCVPAFVGREALKYDACVGKQEWDACVSVDYSYFSGGQVVKFFELPKGRCVRRQCIGPDQLPCTEIGEGHDCQVETLYMDKMVRVNGTCKTSTYAPRCATDESLSDATVVSTVKQIPNTRLANMADLKPEPRLAAPPLSESSGPTPGVGGVADGRVQSIAADVAPDTSVTTVLLCIMATVVALGGVHVG